MARVIDEKKNLIISTGKKDGVVGVWLHKV